MSGGARTYRVGLEGASTLLGKEILAVLKARQFPVSYVIGFQPPAKEPEPPILNIADDPIPVIQETGETEAECDVVFRASTQPPAADSTPAPEPPGNGAPGRRVVIDAAGGSAAGSVLSMPLFDEATPGSAADRDRAGGYFASPHAASIVIAGLMLRLAARFEIRSSSALAFLPASELGPDAIDELQRQTIALLNFGDVPRRIFNAQAAFNLGPRLGGKAKASLTVREDRIRSELERLLKGRAAPPALRLVQAPSFYSMAFCLYIHSVEKVAASQIEQALYGERLQWVRASQPSPSPVDVQGSASLFLDPVVTETGQPGGFWLWGRVDDLRLVAENTVVIAERALASLPI